MITPKSILKEHGLRLTKPRKTILESFIKTNEALSPKVLENLITSELDRVTIYRTLGSFVEAGILHKVLDDSSTTKYALCEQECSTEEHHHNHVHFKCKKCSVSSCLYDVEIPTIKLPTHYQVNEINLLVEGICKHCL